jgi:hypothetical protein
MKPAPLNSEILRDEDAVKIREALAGFKETNADLEWLDPAAQNHFDIIEFIIEEDGKIALNLTLKNYTTYKSGIAWGEIKGEYILRDGSFQLGNITYEPNELNE